MRRWLWVLCVVACSRRIQHFRADAGEPAIDAATDGAADADMSPVVCPQPLVTPAVACAKAGFGLPTALAGDGHVMSRLADVDGDGKLDLVSPELSRNRLAVALGRGDGTFKPPTYTAVVGQPVSLDVADLDGDGDRDVVVGSQETADLSILHNNGAGIFAASTLTVSKARTVAIASLNADSRPDLVIASALDQSVTIVLATATGYAAPVTYSLGFTVMAAATGDLDNDGDVDIVAVGSPYRKVTLTNTGAGAFTASSYPLSSDGNDVAIADFDGDGKRDVAVAETNGIEIYEGTGMTASLGNFQVPKGITAADIDNDGKPDFVVVGWAGLLTIRRGPTGLAVAGYPLELPAQGPEQVAAGDVDGDGHIDLVASSVNNRDNGVLVLRNSGTGVFTLPITLLANGSTTLAATIGDLDGDGRNDLIRVSPMGFEVYLQNAAGAVVSDGVPYQAPNGVIAIGDVTADGRADIVIAGTSEVKVFRGTGGGHFALAGSYPTGSGTSAVYLVDLGGNCAPEIVLVHPRGPAGFDGPSSQTFAVMRNTGHGGFDPEITRAAMDLSSATVGDFDEDGKLDVVAVLAMPQLIAFFPGNGDSTFGAEVTRSVTSPLQVASADIDGDGHRDLILSTWGAVGTGYLLGTMRGHGDGTFDAAVYTKSMSLQTSNTMRVLDFDGDNAVDVVFTNEIGIGVHIGHPDGTFDTVRIYPMGGTPLAVGDLDNDKRADTVGVRTSTLFGETRGTCGP